jgi:serine/threonine protein kinase
MGQVFRGSAGADGDPVAVKLLKPELMSDPEVIARFLQERSILTSVRHPHVVRVLDLVVEGETAGIVMELVPGQDLRHHLSGRRTLPPAQAASFARQLLEGAEAVHAVGIIHRDVKPENVLVDASGDGVILKLTDFGIARLSYGPTLTRQPSLLGTPEYMAPEVADSAQATPAADLYSIGIVLYEMLAGRTPFEGGHPMTVLYRQVEQLPVPVPGIRADLWSLVEWLLAKDPRSRPPTAAAATAALGRLELELAGQPALPPMPPLPETPAPPMTPTPVKSSMMPLPAARAGTSRHLARSGGHPQLADAADLDHPATVLSYVGVGPQGNPDEHAPTADWARDAPPPRPPGPPLRTPEPPRSRASPRLVPAFATTVFLILAAAAVGLVLARSSPGRADGPAAVSYTFAPQEYPDGLLIVRRWTLEGKHGSILAETVSASSAAGRALRVPFRDEIPAAVAHTTRTVVFTPLPTKIVNADPIVEWLLQIPSRGTVEVGYHATLPGLGITKARLMDLVKDFDALPAAAAGMPRPHTIQLTWLAIEPGAVQLEPGGGIRLALAGRLSNGKAAPSAVLSNATWESANQAVASVTSSGTVTGVSTGSADVTAQVGSAQASVPVTVTAAPTKPASTDATNDHSTPTKTITATAKTAQVISFPPPGPGSVSGSATLSAAGGGSGNPVVFTSSTTAVCSVSGTDGTTVAYLAQGSCVINANQAGNAKYQPAPQVTQTITISKTAQVISFPPPGPGSVGGSATLSAAGGGSGNPVVFTSSTTAVCSVSGTDGATVSYLAQGSCVINANQAGNAKYQPASQVTQTITVSPTVTSSP